MLRDFLKIMRGEYYHYNGSYQSKRMKKKGEYYSLQLSYSKLRYCLISAMKEVNDSKESKRERKERKEGRKKEEKKEGR